MDHTEKLNLTKMIDANNVEDFTNDIRQKKHSDLIRNDVTCLLSLKKKIQSFGTIKSEPI